MIGPTNANPKNTVMTPSASTSVGTDTKPIKVVNGVATAVTNDLVSTSGIQTVAGTKTFSSSPVVPDVPADAHSAVNKTYADTKASTVETSITGDGSTTEFNISHSFGKCPQVSLYESNGTEFSTLMQVFVNSVKLIFITAPENGVTYKVVMTR